MPSLIAKKLDIMPIKMEIGKTMKNNSMTIALPSPPSKIYEIKRLNTVLVIAIKER